MKRAIVIYAGSGRVARLAESIAEAMRAGEFDVTMRAAEARPQGVIPLASYDVVCVGASVTSLFGGRLPDSIDATLRQCSRIEGKPVGAFVLPGILGTGKALKQLMGILERQGALVQDFAAIRHKDEALAFGRRLQTLGD